MLTMGKYEVAKALHPGSIQFNITLATFTLAEIFGTLRPSHINFHPPPLLEKSFRRLRPSPTHFSSSLFTSPHRVVCSDWLGGCVCVKMLVDHFENDFFASLHLLEYRKLLQKVNWGLSLIHI